MARFILSMEVADVIGQLATMTDEHGEMVIRKANLVGMLAELFSEESRFNRAQFVDACFAHQELISAEGLRRLMKESLFHDENEGL